MAGHTESLASSEAKRLAEKYDSALDTELQGWLAAAIGSPVGTGNLCEFLKSGVVICEMLNKIFPGTISSIYTGTLPFKQMENISRYIQGCKDNGMKECNLFQTVDLYDAKDPLQVLNNINHLASIASSSPQYKGPQFKGTGASPSQTPAKSTTNIPSHPTPANQTTTPPQSTPVSQNQQNNRPRGGSRRGVSPNAGNIRGRGRGGSFRAPNPNRGQGAMKHRGRGQNPNARGQNPNARGQNPNTRGQNPNAPRGRGVSRVARVRRGRGVSRARRGGSSPRGNVTPAPENVITPNPDQIQPTSVPTTKPQTEKETSSPTTTGKTYKPFVFNSTLSFTGKSNKPAELKKSSPKEFKTPSPVVLPVVQKLASDSPQSNCIPRVASVSSLAEDIATKEMFKYDPEAERSAIEWIEAVIDKKCSGTLHEWLKSGVILCSILNKVKPNSVKQAEESKIAFKHRENIVAYLEACQSEFGINQHSLFQTVDLYEEKNMNIVITSIHHVAKEFAKIPGYHGPRIREVVASANNALFNVSFVSGLPPINEETPIPQEEANMIQWFNSHLSEDHLSIQRVRSDLRDGVRLIKLLEYFSGIPRLGTYVENPSNLWHAMQNVSLLLKFVHQQTGERVEGCRGQEITMGQLEPILHLLKFVRGKFDRDYVFKSQNLTVDSCRIKILEELLETEKTYVSQVHMVVKDIVSVVKEKQLLPDEETWNVFANLQDILAFNEVFLTDLTDRVQKSMETAETALSDLFLSRDQFVPLYSSYVNNFDMATLMVKFNKKKFKPFKKLVKAFEKSQSETSSLDLDSFLILPVQRMPRYLLLLKELYKYTPDHHPDYAGLTSAVDYMSDVMSSINEKKRHAEATNTSHKILNIDKSMLYEMEDFEGIVHPKRVYLYEGVLKWEEMEEEAENPYWFLFNDIIVFCSDLSNDPEAPPDKQFRYVTLMPLKFIDSVADNPDSAVSLDIAMEDEIIVLEALDVDSKNEWQKQIRDAKALNFDLDLVW